MMKAITFLILLIFAGYNIYSMQQENTNPFKKQDANQILFKNLLLEQDSEEEAVQLLDKIDINYQYSPFGDTLLHMAINIKKFRVVEFLLNHNAIIVIANNQGTTPHQLAKALACKNPYDEKVNKIYQMILVRENEITE